MKVTTTEQLRRTVEAAVNGAAVTDVHTHLYSPRFGELLLWGVDDLITYHYLVAETFRWVDLPYQVFWKLSKREQADLIWRTLFLDHSPISESCRGVLTVLGALGLDTASRDLDAYRRHFDGMAAEEYVDTVFELSGVGEVVMTNDPFDDAERAVWLRPHRPEPRFRAALRIDGLLNDWPGNWGRLAEWGYRVEERLDGATVAEVRRFLSDWAGRMGAIYLAASLPPTFTVADDSPRSLLVRECVLPVSQEMNLPFALMIGVKRSVNPALRLAGDGVGRASVDAVEHLCAENPRNKFLVTMLCRENQHELCVAARKFRNLMVFGCWWFLNNPSLVGEITRMRLELLGLSFIPQHSDARVLDQLIYKWRHSRRIIADALFEAYRNLMATGWAIDEAEIARDVAGLFGGNFRSFLERRL